MPSDIEYQQLPNYRGFCACRAGRQIGEIDILVIGVDRIVIESTDIDSAYKNTDLCHNLVECVVEFARRTHRKILSMCPRAQSIFNRCPEFDDVRLIHVAA